MMNRISKKILTGAALALLSMPLFAAELTARQIMDQVDARDTGDNKVSDMTMTLIDKRGSKRIRSIRSYTKMKGADEMRLMFFLSPSDVKNTAFLTYEYDDNRDDDQWLYLPALRKSKRIAASDKSGSFMGSDFNYSDMSSPNLDEYDYKILKEVEVHGHKAWAIEAKPKSQKEIDESGYKKGVVFVRQDNFMVVRGIRWVSDSSDMKYLDVPEVAQIEGIWVALKMTMTTKNGKSTLHRTELLLENNRFNQDLDESMFSVRQIEKGL
ncbi:MAG: outer membrane lipoprotein-sorting protein [Gammaproteobacteria bacterium]|nr:outer membrane lipoprotein-sorting protein [Gammaproteobacteria bacterium]